MQLDALDPRVRPWAEYLVQIGQQYDPALTITSVRRSSSEQARLYRRFLAGQSLYPAAPPGQSKHEFGLAWDMVGNKDVIAWLGGVWESWGGTWGGRFGAADPIHFEV